MPDAARAHPTKSAGTVLMHMPPPARSPDPSGILFAASPRRRTALLPVGGAGASATLLRVGPGSGPRAVGRESSAFHQHARRQRAEGRPPPPLQAPGDPQGQPRPPGDGRREEGEVEVGRVDRREPGLPQSPPQLTPAQRVHERRRRPRPPQEAPHPRPDAKGEDAVRAPGVEHGGDEVTPGVGVLCAPLRAWRPGPRRIPAHPGTGRRRSGRWRREGGRPWRGGDGPR